MGSLSILIVDDQAVFADAVGSRLAAEPDIHPIVVAYGLEEATARLATFRPDVALVDLLLADGSGIDFTRQVRRLSPTTRMIMMSALESTDAVTEAMLHGVRVWLPKTVDSRRLVRMVHAASRGEAWLPRRMLGPVLDRLVDRATGVDQDPLATLSPREHQVLSCLSGGMTREAIARTMHLSANTVRSHVQNTLRKLGAHSTLEAVALFNRAQHRSY